MPSAAKKRKRGAKKRKRGESSGNEPVDEAAPAGRFEKTTKPSSAMRLNAAEEDVCSRMPLGPGLYASIAANPTLGSWRRDSYTKDRAYHELVTALETESTGDVRMILGMLNLWEATSHIPSRSMPSQTLKDDLFRVVNPQHNLHAIGELAHLLHVLAFEAASANVLHAIIAFVDAELPPKTVPKRNFEANHEIKLLYKGWNAKFYGCALEALQETLRKYEGEMERSEMGNIYAKTMNIIQSSGTGKSRLMAALAHEETSVCFTFRSNGESGYPPGDPEIRRFLLNPPTDKDTDKDTELHTRALALLGAVFHELAKWLSEQLPGTSSTRIADDLAERMAPAKVHGPLPAEHMLSDTFAHSRSEFKKKFCADVYSWASDEAERLRADKSWKAYFEASSSSYDDLHKLPAVAQLRTAAEDLCKQLWSRPRSNVAPPPLVVLVFDEAKPLVDLRARCDVYTAARRILGTIKHLPVWAFFLSTNASVVTLGQPRHQDRSTRVAGAHLYRVNAYHALPMNLGMAQRFHSRHHCGADDVTLTPLAEVGTAAHMTLYGRPLWRMYEDRSLDLLRNFALIKLFCNDAGRYDYTNDGHVFAALAARVSLDPCSTPAGLPSSAAANVQADAMKTAVDMHLRFVTDMDEATGVVTTTTPSEPAVSDAVADRFASDPTKLWTTSIESLTRIMQQGIADKGTKGELWARLLFIMAIDMLRHEDRNNPTSGLTSHRDKPFQPVRLLEFLKHLLAPEAYTTLVGMRAQQAARRNSRRAATKAGLDTDTKASSDMDMRVGLDTDMKAGLDMEMVLVEDEVAAVAAVAAAVAAAEEDEEDEEDEEEEDEEDEEEEEEQEEEQEQEVDEERSDAGTDTIPQTVGSAFANAFIHFSRFVATDVNVKDGGAPELLHLLLLQQAALQGAHGQPLWDLLIPVYMGDPNDPFERVSVTALIVQIKNRGKKVAPAETLLTQHNLAKFFGTKFSRPVLFLVLELGIAPENQPENQPKNQPDNKLANKPEKKAGHTGKVVAVCVPSHSFAPHVFQACLRGAAERTYAPLSKSLELATMFRRLQQEAMKMPQLSTIAERICYDATLWRQQTFKQQFARQQRQQKTKDATATGAANYTGIR